MEPFITLIIPCYNEEKFIGKILDQLLAQEYPADRMEILVVDGNSRDKTRQVAMEYSGNHSSVRLLINERQYVPFALNTGIKNAKGDLVFIIGSHSEYPEDYVRKLVKYSFSLDADNVGGICVSRPPDGSARSLAISKALSSSFGVGNAHFRTGTKKVMKADTVTFGCYKKSVFDRIGLFDEELIRNQDDEFNARLVKNGGSVYLVPDVEVIYYTRNRISSMARMLYQYGLFKPLVSWKIGKPTTVRQLVPPGFVIFLAAGIIGALFNKVFSIILIAGVGLHVIAGAAVSVKTAAKEKKYQLILFLPWLFFLMHLSYGWGYLTGIYSFLILKKRKRSVNTTRQ